MLGLCRYLEAVGTRVCARADVLSAAACTAGEHGKLQSRVATYCACCPLNLRGMFFQLNVPINL